MRIFRLIFMVLTITSSPARSGAPNVVTDIAPVHSLVASVMGDLGQPTLLLSGVDDPHHMQLRPSQARALAQADLVFWIGSDLTPWLTAPIANLSDNSRKISLLTVPETALQRSDSGTDPHAWLNPDNAVIWIDAIAQALSHQDPENQRLYLENADRTAADIAALTQRIQSTLLPLHNQPLVFDHGAFGYFADRFDLDIAGVISPNDSTTPGAAHLKNIRSVLQSGNIACAIAQTGESPTFLNSLTTGTGTPVAQLDPMGATQKPAPDLYPALIQKIASGLVTCVNQ
ncbi:MAG: zinc ABC transporter substrate-binding protein [Paracoccaceae bacterium]